MSLPNQIEASMRPPEFTGGNNRPMPAPSDATPHASMRPPEFTGGNLVVTYKGMHKIVLLQ